MRLEQKIDCGSESGTVNLKCNMQNHVLIGYFSKPHKLGFENVDHTQQIANTLTIIDGVLHFLESENDFLSQQWEGTPAKDFHQVCLLTFCSWGGCIFVAFR